MSGPPGYHDDFRGCVFQEVGGKKRTLKVSAQGLYHVYGETTSPRGRVSTLQVYRKQLIDPTRWRRVDGKERTP